MNPTNLCKFFPIFPSFPLKATRPLHISLPNVGAPADIYTMWFNHFGVVSTDFLPMLSQVRLWQHLIGKNTDSSDRHILGTYPRGSIHGLCACC